MIFVNRLDYYYYARETCLAMIFSVIKISTNKLDLVKIAWF